MQRRSQSSYTIVDGARLCQIAKKSRPETFEERKRWVTAQRLWLRARSHNVAMLALLGDATDCSRLLYWGVLTDIDVAGNTTRFQIDRLRPISGRHTPQELVLRSTGKTIAPRFIRPYAVCRTPVFVSL
jgi:hypothetical protein